MDDIIKSYEEAINKLQDAVNTIKEVMDDLCPFDVSNETINKERNDDK